MSEIEILLIASGFIVGFGIAFLLRGRVMSKKYRQAREESTKIINEARSKAEALLKEANLEAKDRLYKMKSEFDLETKETKNEIKRREKRINQKEENYDRKADQIEKKEKEQARIDKDLHKRTEKIKKSEKKYHDLIEEEKKQLEKISTLTAEQAKELLLRAMENEARYESAKLIKRIENESREQADKKAKKIMATAIQRYAGDFIAERTVSVVQLPSDEMKGRIIGREGRNIRALEAATGIDTGGCHFVRV